MPQPGDAHVSRPLTNISIAYMQSPNKYIARRVFPNVPVGNRADSFYRYSKSGWLRSEAKPRAPGTESAGSGWTIDTDTYSAKVYAVHKDVDDQTRANMDAPLNLDRDATQWVTGQLMLQQDQRWQEQYFASGVWTTDVQGVADDTPSAGQVNQWNDADSTPIQDVQNYSLVIEGLTGYMPNKLVVGPAVFNALTNHPDILDRIKYTQRGVVTAELLAALFNLDEVLVGRALQNSAQEGAADDLDFVLGKNALLVYAAPNASLMQPSAGYTFSWTGYLGAAQNGAQVSKFRIEERKSDRIEGETAYDMKVVAPDLGVFFDDVVA